MTQFLIDIITTVLAFIIGIVMYKKMNLFYRLLFVQIIVYLLVQSAAFFISNHNNWLFNLFIPIETLLLLASAYYYFNLKSARRLLILIFLTFMLVYLLDLFLWLGFNTFAFHAAIVEGIAISGVYLFIFYFQFHTNAPNNWPLLFVCIGHVLYFMCSVPYLSILFYFQNKNPILNRELFVYIVLLLAQIRYLFLAIAFFLIRNKRFSYKHFQTIT